MTLDQILLAVIVTAAGVLVALWVHSRQATWRRRDLLREFIGRWAAETTVLSEVAAARLVDEHTNLRIEKEALFPVALKLIPWATRRQYKQFLNARSKYMLACYELFRQLETHCSSKTGFPIGIRDKVESWPERILRPEFVDLIWDQLTKPNPHIVEESRYEIKDFTMTYSPPYITRKGIHLTCTYRAFHETELAEITTPDSSAEAELEKVKRIHQEMMSREYGKLLAGKVSEMHELQTKASKLSQKMNAALRKIQAS